MVESQFYRSCVRRPTSQIATSLFLVSHVGTHAHAHVVGISLALANAWSSGAGIAWLAAPTAGTH